MLATEANLPEQKLCKRLQFHINAVDEWIKRGLEPKGGGTRQ